jgi:crotonobetainyl-CoA:carnitine CoA-transferase CaiB-like acyl-CoA transferase
VTTDPLAGVRVIELCRGAGGLAATGLLAGLGADVVQVQAAGPAAAVDEPFQIWADRDKQRQALSPDDGDDLAMLRHLIDAADVFVADPPPGRLESRGLDAVTLSDRNPDLIHVWLPAFGWAGRGSQLEYDPLLLAAVSGYAGHYPADQEQPIAPVVPTFAYLHGAMGAAATVAGLVGRQRDGQGRSVRVSGLHAVGAALATLMAQGVHGDQVISPGRSTRGGPFFRLYQGADGAWFYLAALSPAIFFRALDAVGRMDIMVRDDVAGEFTNLIQPAVMNAVNTELETTFATRPTGEWLGVLRAAEVPAAAVWDTSRWAASDVAAQVTGWTEWEEPGRGKVRAPAFPLALTAGPTSGSPLATEPTERRHTERPHVEPGGLPLRGVRVVDISSYLAAPFASALLAHHGAEVIKVEPVEGDPYRVHSISHAVANQHKRGAALDLKDAEARHAFLHLVRGADVVVDNFRGDSLARVGLDEATFQGANPALVRCSISAFGTEAPWADLPGFDPVLQSMTGLAAAQGGDGPPSPSTAPVVDVATGALGALGSLSALYATAVDGRSRHVRTSLAAGAVFVQSGETTSYASRPAAARGGVAFIGPDPAVRYYRARDQWLGVAARTDELLWRLCQVCGVEAADRVALEEALGRADAVSWVDRLTLAGVPAAIALERAGAIRDRYLMANGITTQLDIPDIGLFQVIGSYSDWQGAASPSGRAYRLGQDTESALVEAGLDRQTIQNLVQRGAAGLA